MTPFDYLIDIALIAVVAFQIRPRTLTRRSILLPLGLVAWAGTIYLRPIPVAGNNVGLIVLLVTVGLTLGALSGLATRVLRSSDVVLAQAGVLAAFLWVLGMGARFAFAVWATHDGAGKIERFSIHEHLVGGHVWQFALVLMAYAEVLARVGVLEARRRRALRSPASPSNLVIQGHHESAPSAQAA